MNNFVYKQVTMIPFDPAYKGKFFSYASDRRSKFKLEYMLNQTTTCIRDFLPIFTYKDKSHFKKHDLVFKCKYEPAREQHIGPINFMFLDLFWKDLLHNHLKIKNENKLLLDDKTIFCHSVTPIEFCEVI